MKILRKEIVPGVELVSVSTARDITLHTIYITAFDAETQAALGASLSRDPGSLPQRLKKVFESEAMRNRIMDTFFKKYNHNSIGDLGFLLMSIEGLSMKGAVNVVEHQLFNGQEASTRYINFSKMGLLPIDSAVDAYAQKCLDCYNALKDDLQKHFVQADGLEPSAAEPKAFDIAGGFLPLAARTNVFWAGHIRVYIDKIRELMSGDVESREIGHAMETLLDAVCPNSVRKVGEDYLRDQLDIDQSITSAHHKKIAATSSMMSFDGFDLSGFIEYIKRGGSVNMGSKSLTVYGNITSAFDFDFRSARDIHRHRAFPVNRVVKYEAAGLGEFYLKSIPWDAVRKETRDTMEGVLTDCSKLESGEYGMPMATKFPYIVSGPLHAWIYFLRLRTAKTVHPTLIDLAQSMGSVVEGSLHLSELYLRTAVDYDARSADANKV